MNNFCENCGNILANTELFCTKCQAETEFKKTIDKDIKTKENPNAIFGFILEILAPLLMLSSQILFLSPLFNMHKNTLLIVFFEIFVLIIIIQGILSALNALKRSKILKAKYGKLALITIILGSINALLFILTIILLRGN